MQTLGHGVNLGNALEAPREGEWGVTLHEDYFAVIAQAGFNTVRVPIRWSAHAGKDAPYTIEPTFLQRVDWVVSQAKLHHLNVILDFHNYDALMKDSIGNKERFLGIWKQVAEHYQSEPATVLFELMNEPNDKLDALTWNDLIARAVAIIRPTNPTRWIVAGPVGWNGIRDLPKLELPENDHYLVATIHYYDPMKFTHQGAEWINGSTPWLGTTWQGNDAEKQAINQAFDQVSAWGKEHRRPMFLGEFGSYCKGDMDSRQRWTQAVARSAEAHGVAWTYWEFCAGFGVYDPVLKQWRAPLLQALLPGAKL